MPFSYATGTANSIAEWFAIFQAFVVGRCGWSIFSGQDTTDMVILTQGLDTTYRNLYARVWHTGGNLVNIEVRNDAGGTQETTSPAWSQLDTGGAPFTYFMNGDVEAFNVVWRTGAGAFRWRYAGTLMDLGIGAPDETYRAAVMYMIDRNPGGTVLHYHDGTWDQDLEADADGMSDNIRRCQYDNSFMPCGLFLGHDQAMAGQARHVSGYIIEPAFTVLDTLHTGPNNWQTNWILLQDQDTKMFAFRTGGRIHCGVQIGTPTLEQGVTTSPQDFIQVVLPAFMTATGWTDLGDPGGPHTVNRLFYSTGESGQDDIYILICWLTGVNALFYGYVQDDPPGTHRTGANVSSQAYIRGFPKHYYLAGDRDCMAFFMDGGFGVYDIMWLGKVLPANHNLPSAPYSMAAYGTYLGNSQLLRAHDGVWVQPGFIGVPALIGNLSTPNLYDDQAAVIWPICLLDNMGAAQYDPMGLLKYVGYMGDSYVNSGDRVYIAEEEHFVGWNTRGWMGTIRTV